MNYVRFCLVILGIVGIVSAAIFNDLFLVIVSIIVLIISQVAPDFPGGVDEHLHDWSVPRSPEWPAVRAKWLKDHPSCAACGETKNIEVHHVIPFHLHPELELDPTNFITLCAQPSHNDHYIFGHLLDYLSWNVNVREEAAKYLAEIKSRPH
jgi:5-methylcytosine-specific restriction enzyme A